MLRNLIRKNLGAAVSRPPLNAAISVATRNISYTNWPFLSEEHVMIAETAKSFAESELQPRAFDVSRLALYFLIILPYCELPAHISTG